MDNDTVICLSADQLIKVNQKFAYMEYLKSEIEAKDALISELNKIMVNGRVEVDKIGLIASQALDMNNALTKEVDTLQKDLLKMKKKAKFNFAGGAIASALLILILL